MLLLLIKNRWKKASCSSRQCRYNGKYCYSSKEAKSKVPMKQDTQELKEERVSYMKRERETERESQETICPVKDSLMRENSRRLIRLRNPHPVRMLQRLPPI
jgi:hypothetical protein